MKPLLAAIIMAFPLLLQAQYTYKNLQVNYLENAAVAKSYTHENLRLYPIYAKQGFKEEFKSLGRYTSLQDALGANKVKITERSNEGTVSNLIIENTSADTIIVIAGDVVKGGKQDRIVEEDIVLPPKSGKKTLKVFCVESGRWSDNNRSSNNRVVKQPNAAPEFKQHYNKGSMSLRKVVEKDKQQSSVWNKVEDLAVANKTTTATKTYTALNNSADYSKRLDGYLDFFRSKFRQEKDVIGVVVVTGDKVLGCDMFATADLFSSQFPSLLHSYATEAIVKGKPVTIAAAEVKKYMDQFLTDEKVQQATVRQKGNAFTEKGKKLRVSGFD